MFILWERFMFSYLLRGVVHKLRNYVVDLGRGEGVV